MDLEEYFNSEEKPLDKLVDGLSNTGIFRKMAFIGDSLSSGEFESRDDEGKSGYNDYYEYSWGQYIARKNGFKAYNFSRGGMTAKWYVEGYADEKGLWNVNLACQGYVVALGVNDIFGQKQPLGSVDDIDLENPENNKPTFAGYLGKIISRYKKIQPQAKFFFVSMPRESEDMSDPKNLLKKEHAELLYDLCKKYDNSYVIDLFKYAPVYDEEFKKHFYLYGHMNAEGYILTAKMIDSYIDYIIRRNPDDFRRVPFIGKGLK